MNDSPYQVRSAKWLSCFMPVLLLWLCLMGNASFSPASCHGAAARQPDIVVFLTDDQGQKDLSVWGDKALRTPNMQRLANEGMVFSNAYVASPTCAPSRAALLTGLMPAKNGAEPNHGKPRPEIRKLPSYLQELGYEVVAFGKVSHYRHTGLYGFDFFANDTFHDHKGIQAAVEFLKKRTGTEPRKPLCLFVGSNWPHVPWPENHSNYDPEEVRLPAGSIDTPQTRQWRARYLAAVTKADDDLGVILDAARAWLGTNTLFLFTSDNGAQWPFAKWNCYETGVKTPLIAVWPGMIKPQTRSGAMVSWVDILPTLVEAAGGKPPENIDGRSFLPVLRQKKSQHRKEIFSTHSGDGNWNIYPIRAVRAGQWKYIRNLHPEFAYTTHIDLPGNLGQRAFFSSWEKAAATNPEAARILKRYHVRPAEELYDLASDPFEQKNLAAEPAHARTLRKMREKLDKWMKAQKDSQAVFGLPRPVSNSLSYGPNAPSGEQWK